MMLYFNPATATARKPGRRKRNQSAPASDARQSVNRRPRETALRVPGGVFGWGFLRAPTTTASTPKGMESRKKRSGWGLAEIQQRVTVLHSAPEPCAWQLHCQH